MDYSQLPNVNAALNSLSAISLLTGVGFIKTGRREAHRVAMLVAFGCSALFMVSYLVYHFQVGSVRFQGTGALRTFYLSILLIHTVLAAAVPFLAVITLVFALRGRFERHRRIARWALPIWLIVSVTGVVVYWMLYRL